MRLTPPPGVKVKYRTGLLSSLSLIATGVAVDAAQILFSLTGIGEPISVAIGMMATVLIPLMAFLMGSRFGIKEIGTFLAGDAVEFLPFVNDLPGFTAQTVTTVLLSRSQDIERAIRENAAKRTAANDRGRAAAMRQHMNAARQQQAASAAEARMESREAA